MCHLVRYPLVVVKRCSIRFRSAGRIWESLCGKCGKLHGQIRRCSFCVDTPCKDLDERVANRPIRRRVAQTCRFLACLRPCLSIPPPVDARAGADPQEQGSAPAGGSRR